MTMPSRRHTPDAPPPRPVTVVTIAALALMWSLVCDWFGARALRRLDDLLATGKVGQLGATDESQGASSALMSAVFFHALQLVAALAWVVCLFMAWRLHRAGHRASTWVTALVLAAPMASVVVWLVLRHTTVGL